MTPSFNESNDRQAALLIRMAQLIARERLGELNDAEREELNGWLAESGEHLAWKDQLWSQEYVSGLLEDFQASEAGVEASLKSFHQKHLNVRPLNRWWAAAAVFVPLILAAVWLVEKHSAPVPATSSVAADVWPGRNTATLTLANGQHVLLDTGMSGQLVQKGGVQIHYDQGRVDYQATKLADSEVTYNTLATAKGGAYQLVLPDGSRVWLNAASSIRYPTAFTGKERHVELTGEAYFEVAQRKNQPFSVGVGTMDVKVLGTEFDIMAYPEEGKKKTTLVSGAVKVENGTEARQPNVGEQAIVSETGGLSVDAHVDVESVIAWKLGFFQFTHIDIKTMMREIARWYDVDVVYQREDLSGEYGGRISRKLNLSELISLLEGNGVGHFKIEGRRLIVLP